MQHSIKNLDERKNLILAIQKNIEFKEYFWIELINKASPNYPILEVLTDKTLLKIILDERNRRPFKSFRDIECRIVINRITRRIARRIVKLKTSGVK